MTEYDSAQLSATRICDLYSFDEQDSGKGLSSYSGTDSSEDDDSENSEDKDSTDRDFVVQSEDATPFDTEPHDYTLSFDGQTLDDMSSTSTQERVMRIEAGKLPRGKPESTAKRQRSGEFLHGSRAESESFDTRGGPYAGNGRTSVQANGPPIPKTPVMMITALSESNGNPVIAPVEGPVLRPPFAYWKLVETTTYGDYFEDEHIAAKTYGEAQHLMATRILARENPWEPFLRARDFEMAKWFVQFNIAKGAIDTFFARGLDGDQTMSFWNADQLWTLLENNEFGFASTSWTRHEIDSQHFYTRDLRNCIQHLLGHHPFARKPAFRPGSEL